MTIHFSPAALRDLQAMPTADERRMLADLERLEAVAHTGRLAELAAQEGVRVTAIAGERGLFRVRRGDWRALVRVQGGDEVMVERVRNRRDAYD